jgi:toxin-antitoxin system PIN domain toxin
VTVHLLDTNLLIALAWPQHVHHAQAHAWFGRIGREAWATCPLTQVAFIRISSNPKIIPDAVSPREALATLAKIVAVPGHQFWPDGASPTVATAFASLSLVGHRQVTDAYLLSLAQHHNGKLATFDRGVVELIQVPKDRTRHVTVIPAE